MLKKFKMTKYLIRTEQADRFDRPSINKFKITAKNEAAAVTKILMKLEWVEKNKEGIKEAKRWMKENKEGKGEYVDEELIIEVEKI